MKKKDFIDAIGDIDYDMVEDAEVKRSGHTGKRATALMIAALVSLIALTSVTVGLNYKKEPQPLNEPTSTSSNTQNPSDTGAWFTKIDPFVNNAPKEFFSFEELAEHEKSLGEYASECYYIPSALGGDYELYKILRQEKNSTYNYEYIEVKYKLRGAEIDEGSLIDLRTKLISCEYSVREYSDEAFENYIDNGFEAFEYNGKQIYKINNYTVDETTLLSYHVIFLEDGHLVGMFLPAIDTFENMMKYTDVVRVDIK